MKISHIFIFFGVLYNAHIDSFDIQLLEVNQDDCITHCKKGLIAGLDTVVFNSEVNITEDPGAKHFYFQKSKGNDTQYQTVCLLDLSQDCKKYVDGYPCQCKLKSRHFFNVSYSQAVHDIDNGSQLRANIVMSFKNHTVSSSEWRDFPVIHAPNDSTGKMTINKKHIDYHSISEMKVKGHELSIEFTCSSRGVPCVIEISANDSSHKAEGKQHVLYCKKYNTDAIITVTVKHALCSFSGNINTLKLLLYFEYEQHYIQEKFVNTIVYITVTVGTFGITFTALVLRKKLLRHLKKCRSREGAATWRQSHKDKHQDGREENSLIGQGQHLITYCVASKNNDNLGNHECETFNSIHKKVEVIQGEFYFPSRLAESGYTPRPSFEMSFIVNSRSLNENSENTIQVSREIAHWKTTDSPRVDPTKALLVLVEKGDVEEVRKLPLTSVNINEQNHRGHTPLMIAAKKSNTHMVRLLLENDADVNIAAENGYTALMWASYYPACSEIAKLLIEFNANLDAKENNGWTALMIASQRGNYDVVVLLLKYGANVNAQNNRAETALMFSASNGHHDIAKALLDEKAKLELKSNDHKTALDFARENNHESIIELIGKFQQEEDITAAENTLEKQAQHVIEEIDENIDVRIV